MTNAGHQEQGDRLHDGEVLLRGGLHEERADAVETERLLHDDAPAMRPATVSPATVVIGIRALRKT